MSKKKDSDDLKKSHSDNADFAERQVNSNETFVRNVAPIPPRSERLPPKPKEKK